MTCTRTELFLPTRWVRRLMLRRFNDVHTHGAFSANALAEEVDV